MCASNLADRLVDDTRPYPDFGYNSARGDQCEKCCKRLNPSELIHPKCKVCRNSAHIRDTNHLFLLLPLLKDKREKYKSTVEGSWSNNAKDETNAWLDKGLRQRCITRDLKWGVPIPYERFKDKVFYVWFDAPIGYISITACYTPEWEKWWKNPKDEELYQFMGKDNVPFHTIMFPSTLLGTDENWTLLKKISVTDYLKYEKGDSLFTWTNLQTKINNELISNLGNFINRVLCFIARDPGYNSIVPNAPGAAAHPSSETLGKKIGTKVDEYMEAMEYLTILFPSTQEECETMQAES